MIRTPVQLDCHVLSRPGSRRGFMMPALAVFLIALFAFVALAVDIGMITVARTQCQNAADVAALTGTRNLNNKEGVSTPSNVGDAVLNSRAVLTNNNLLNEKFTATQISSIEVGVFDYDTTAKRFAVPPPGKPGTWTNVTGGATPSPPEGKSWTAMRVKITVEQPTYFARVLGFNTMPTGALATSVYRPRDVAFVLDMTGSMAYSSTTNSGTWTSYDASMDPNTLVPEFGHYANIQSSLIATQDRSNSNGEIFSRNNISIATPNGPPMVRNFWFDPSNLSNPATSVRTPALVTVTEVVAGKTVTYERPESNAFHRSNVTESGGNASTFTPPTYNFSSYNPDANSSTEGCTPAPDFYGEQIDQGTVKYSGDRWRRKDGTIRTSSTSWTASSTRAAANAAELLGYWTSTSSNPPSGFTSNWLNFRDPLWELYGYDLDIPKYRSRSGNTTPANPNTYRQAHGATVNNPNPILVPAAERFKGYSMGPGYWGKTFFIWPPDPRPEHDWRKKFFTNWTGTPTQTSVNNGLLNTSAGSYTLKSSGYTIDYSAVLAWIKSGPQTLPPNLRAGRVVYYTSIPNNVTASSGDSTEVKLDKAFWKAYIDWVLRGVDTGGTQDPGYLYGTGDSWTNGSTNISTSQLTTYNFGSSFPSPDNAARYPYMRYTDSPNRPRLHMWFGPLTVIDFLSRRNVGSANRNWLPGTSYEAQCWQLKAAMNSVIDDVRNNHPNDTVGLTMFGQNHSDIRVEMTQDYNALKNALFYPKSLLADINAGNKTKEFRPFDTSMGGYDKEEIPNSDGNTDPNTGLALAFNLLSPSSKLGSQYGTVRGRRGASKLVIFETDGVPSGYRSVSLNKFGYDTYYSVGNFTSASNGASNAIDPCYSIVDQMAKQMSTSNGNNVDSGLSLPSAPCKVYSIGFGDLFDPATGATFRTQALSFLAGVQVRGGTSPSGSSTIPSHQIITGEYQTRINTLKTCLQRIFSSGVTVSLIE